MIRSYCRRAGLQFQGTGANRTLRIVPAQDRYGTAKVFVTLFDGQASVVDEFRVTVLSVNDAPATIGLSSSSVLGLGLWRTPLGT